jgi:hypothetical protein
MCLWLCVCVARQPANGSIVVVEFVGAKTCLPSCYLTTTVSSGSTIGWSFFNNLIIRRIYGKPYDIMMFGRDELNKSTALLIFLPFPNWISGCWIRFWTIAKVNDC